MLADTERHLRADAARNAERILRATREVYAEVGPDASLDDIARRARVGVRTLYRHFPNKQVLARAALAQSVAEELAPAIERALADDNPRRGLAALMEAAMSMAARERNTLAVAGSAGALSAPFYEALDLLVRRAQEAGVVRGDLVPSDLPRILRMLVSVLGEGSDRDGWRRYLALVLDGMSAPTVGNGVAAAGVIPSKMRAR